MTRVLRTALVVGMIVVMASAASAQQQPPQRGQRGQPGGGFGGFGGFGGGGAVGLTYLALLRNETVQKDLELVDDQKTKLAGVNEQLQAKIRESFQGAGGFGRRGDQQQSEEEREKARAEREKRNQELTKEIKAKIGEVLLPHQMERLDEIALQVRGTAALEDPEIAKELGITDEQKAQFAKVREEGGQKMRELFQGGNREGIQEKMAEMRREQNEKTLAVLTADQKAKYEKMQGEKINIDARSLLGGFGGGQGGQRRRGNGNNNNDR
jgi:Spy/CpxP family protein refolding chaperone